MEFYDRTLNLLGEDSYAKLESAKVIVFGVGGVGGYVVEALSRAGIGHIDLVDNDTISLSNINRQIIATNNNIGNLKVDEFKKRINSINPKCVVNTYPIFYLSDKEDLIDLSKYDYIIDAIDTVSAKLLLVEKSLKLGIKIISSMGTANKLDPSKLVITDISKTNTCPLAKAIRVELRKRGINHLKCVYSNEEPINPGDDRKGSISYLPPMAGLLIASEVIRDLIKK